MCNCSGVRLIIFSKKAMSVFEAEGTSLICGIKAA
ncbi:MAG: hypothetical protein K6G90_11495 [Clostridia bacterium]|nr:hypothetical protein [Clostridia bacterium]